MGEVSGEDRLGRTGGELWQSKLGGWIGSWPFLAQVGVGVCRSPVCWAGAAWEGCRCSRGWVWWDFACSKLNATVCLFYEEGKTKMIEKGENRK